MILFGGGCVLVKRLSCLSKEMVHPEFESLYRKVLKLVDNYLLKVSTQKFAISIILQHVYMYVDPSLIFFFNFVSLLPTML